jgi:hypothetical protein
MPALMRTHERPTPDHGSDEQRSGLSLPAIRAALLYRNATPDWGYIFITRAGLARRQA